MALNLANDFWINNKKQYDAAETQYYESLTKELLNRKIELNCNGDAHEFSCNSLDENSSSSGKPKKSAKNKNKTNSLEVSSNYVETAIAANQQPKSTSKKNKKKSKSQAHKDDVDALVHCNNVAVKKQSNAPSNDSKRGTSSNNHCTLVSEIAKAREHIKNSLEKMDGMTSIGGPANSSELLNRIASVEKENADLKNLVESLKNLVLDSQKRIAVLEGKNAGVKQQPAANPVAAPTKPDADDDDGVDLFASDDDEDESAEAARVREERLAAYAAKKSKKPALIAKSSLILDVKPWDDETDLKAMEAQIRTITTDGLLWGASRFVPVAFGIQKLSISCVVEDEKVSIDWLTEEIEKNEDFVQSVDVAAFNKI